jgi:hypothetical protein
VFGKYKRVILLEGFVVCSYIKRKCPNSEVQNKGNDDERGTRRKG